MARLEPLDLSRLTPEQKEVADAIVAGPRGGLRGPFEAWLRSPGLADPAQRVGAFVRYGTTLTPDLTEIAILLTGQYWQAQFEFWAHARLARQAGVPDAVIEAIRTGREPGGLEGARRLVYDVVSEYLRTRRLSDATYARAVADLGERGLVELVGVVGYYGLVSMTLNVFEVEVPPGEPAPFAEPPGT